MTTATRYLYLARHGEASQDESELTEAGRRQAGLLGVRLRGIPFTAVYHGPLARTTETARLVNEHLPDVRMRVDEIAGDYVPHVPDRDELPPEYREASARFFAQFSEEERERGRALAEAAVRRFTGPADGADTRHDLVITHNFLVGWLVRGALDAPAWRWLSLNHGNAALTVIRYAPGRPSSILAYNDMGHLPVELRWTGFEPRQPW